MSSATSNALMYYIQVLCGWHRTLELLQHLRRSFPGTSSPEPVVLPSFIAVIPTNDDLLGETLEIVRALAIRGVLHGVVSSKLLQRKVEEAVDVVEDLECHQGLHRIRVELRETDVQVQQSLPKEWV